MIPSPFTLRASSRASRLAQGLLKAPTPAPQPVQVPLRPQPYPNGTWGRSGGGPKLPGGPGKFGGLWGTAFKAFGWAYTYYSFVQWAEDRAPGVHEGLLRPLLGQQTGRVGKMTPPPFNGGQGTGRYNFAGVSSHIDGSSSSFFGTNWGPIGGVSVADTGGSYAENAIYMLSHGSGLNREPGQETALLPSGGTVRGYTSYRLAESRLTYVAPVGPETGPGAGTSLGGVFEPSEVERAAAQGLGKIANNIVGFRPTPQPNPPTAPTKPSPLKTPLTTPTTPSTAVPTPPPQRQGPKNGPPDPQKAKDDKNKLAIPFPLPDFDLPSPPKVDSSECTPSPCEKKAQEDAEEIKQKLDDIEEKVDEVLEKLEEEKEEPPPVEIAVRSINLIDCESSPKVRMEALEILDTPRNHELVDEILEMANLAVRGCEFDGLVAAVPDWWQVRVGAGRPQLITIYRRVGTVTYHRIALPWPSDPTPTNESKLGPYQKGPYQVCLTLLDNSKFICYCETESEGLRMAQKAATLIQGDKLSSPLDIRITRTSRGVPAVDEMEPTREEYYPEGLQNLKPAWRKGLGGRLP